MRVSRGGVGVIIALALITLALRAYCGGYISHPAARLSDPALGRGLLLVHGDVAGGRGGVAGTAMMVTSDGYALTCHHVISESRRVWVQVASNGHWHRATVVGRDAPNDLAVLKIDLGKDRPAQTVAINRRAGPNLGDRVTAVGNAHGGGRLVEAVGNVSTLGLSVRVRDNGSVHQDLIGVDGDIVPGDSGGPLFDAKDRVIGINAFGGESRSGQHVGAAVPILTVLKLMDVYVPAWR